LFVFLLFFFVLFGFHLQLHAAETVPGAGEEDGYTETGEAVDDNSAAYDIRGFVRGEVHVPANKRDDSAATFGSSDKYLMATTELKLDAFFTDTVSAFVNLRYRLKDDDRGPDPAGYIGEDADRDFDVREAYFQWRGPWLDVTAGQQIIVWGAADGFNPTGKVWPKDFTIVSTDRDDRRLGVPALKGDVYLGAYTFTGIWQPFFVDAKFRLSSLPEEAEITINDPDLPEDELSNSNAAVKLAAAYGATDLSVSYFYGWDPYPDIILDRAVLSDENTEVWVTPVYNRIENYGMDFSAVLGPIILRGEAAYTRVKERGERSVGRRKSEIAWIVGPEWEWFEKFTVNVQYGTSHVLDWEPVPTDESEIENDPQAGVDAFNARLNRQLRAHNPLATLRIDYRLLQDTLFLQFRGFYYIEDEEVRLRPRAVYDINDHVSIALGASLSYGPAGSRFHRSGENYNEVFTELKYSF
jgi:hypothetical protein